MLTAGSDIEAQNCYLETALIQAASAGHDDVVRELVSRQVNVHHQARYCTVTLLLSFATCVQW